MNEVAYFHDLLERTPLPAWNVAKAEPYRLEIRLGSPVAMAQPWISFDSLVQYLMLEDALGEDLMLMSRTCRVDFPEQWQQLPFQRTAEIWHASASVFIPATMPRVTSYYKRFETRGSESLRKKKIQRDGFYWRDFILREPYFPCHTVLFFACGDPEFMRELLERHLLGVGRDFRIGWGAVRSWNIERLDTDCSLVLDGRAARPIPVTMCSDYDPDDTAVLRIRPPYWQPGNECLCVPPGGRCVL